MKHTTKLLVLVAGVAGAAGLATAGWAYWSAGGTGTAAGSVGSLNAPTNVIASPTPGSGTVPVSWTASSTTPPLAVAPTGYYVQRYSGSTPSQACGSSPSSLLSGTSCYDQRVADGTYTYQVTAVFRSWTGQSAASDSVTVVNDATPPTVSSISRLDGAANPTNAASVTWTVTFSENVTGVDADDFTLVRTDSVTGGSVTTVTGAGTTWTVTATTGTGDGTLGLNLTDDDTIVDGVGNKLGGTDAGNGNLTGETYSIDKTAPSVLSIDRAGANPTNAASVSWTVAFSETVNGADADDFALAATGVSGASITSATGESFTVIAGTGSGDGSLGLNLVDNDTIVDRAGNTLGGNGTVNGDFTGQLYTIDKTAPTTTDNASSAWTSTAQTVTLTATDTGGASVSNTYYTTDGSTPTTGSPQGNTINLSTQGIYTIKYFSVDNAGNSEAVKTAANQVRIDTTAPTPVSSVIADATVNSAGFVHQAGTYYIYGNAADIPAGVTAMSANVNNITTGATSIGLSSTGGPWTVSGTSYAFRSQQQTANSSLSAGSKTYTVTATDNASNTSNATSGSVTVDNTTPTAVSSVIADASANVAGFVHQGGSYYVYGRASDAAAGVAAMTANVNNITTGATSIGLSGTGGPWTVSGTSYAFRSQLQTANASLSAGSKTFSVTATDNAGNTTSPATSASVSVDNTAPVVTITSMASGGGSSKIDVVGTATAGDGAVTVYLCLSTPCSASNVVTNGTLTATPAGNGSWSVGSGNIGSGTYYATALQTDAAGNTGTRADFGPFVR